MAEYQAVYKCPLCGALISDGNVQEVNYEDLPKLLGKVVQNQLFAGNPYLHEAQMYVPHKCNSGNAGLAAFAGFVKV